MGISEYRRQIVVRLFRLPHGSDNAADGRFPHVSFRRVVSAKEDASRRIYQYGLNARQILPSVSDKREICLSAAYTHSISTSVRSNLGLFRYLGSDEPYLRKYRFALKKVL